MTEIVIIYHSPCPDGFTAAWIAKEFFERDPTAHVEFIAGSYSNGTQIVPNVFEKRVYMLDFSYPRRVMEDIAMQADEVIILDHHVSAQEDVMPLIESGMVQGIFDMNRSGAMIAWEYFNPDVEPPALVKYVQDRDLWEFDLLHSREITMAIYSYDYTFENWDFLAGEIGCVQEMLRGSVSDSHNAQFLNAAIAMYRLHMKNVREIITPGSELQLKIGCHIVPAYNANNCFGSDLCGAVIDAGSQPIVAYFWINGQGQYIFGLRSALDGPDVAKIAASYGGGGHKHASGFRVNSLEDL